MSITYKRTCALFRERSGERIRWYFFIARAVETRLRTTMQMNFLKEKRGFCCYHVSVFFAPKSAFLPKENECKQRSRFS